MQTMEFHPHFDAVYRILPGDKGGHQIEIAIPGSSPTKVSPFDTEALAEQWIANHKLLVAQGPLKRRSYNQARRPRSV
jgi:hypothetical protein